MTNTAAGMPCPVCKTPLVMSERQGVEIDYCPQCRGVWLDRGELDKILERGATEIPASATRAPAAAPHYDHDRRHEPGYGRGHGYPKRRKSFLEELFD